MKAWASGGAFSVTTTSTFPEVACADGASASAAARMRRPRFRSEMVRLHWAVCADVAELVDAHGSGPCGGNPVEVQVLSSASGLSLCEVGNPCTLRKTLLAGHAGRSNVNRQEERVGMSRRICIAVVIVAGGFGLLAGTLLPGPAAASGTGALTGPDPDPPPPP